MYTQIKKFVLFSLIGLPLFTLRCMEDKEPIKKKTEYFKNFTFKSFTKKFADTCYNQSLWIASGLHLGYFAVRRKLPSTIFPIFTNLITGGAIKTASHNYLSNTGEAHRHSRTHCYKMCENSNDQPFLKQYPLSSSIGQIVYANPYFIAAGLSLFLRKGQLIAGYKVGFPPDFFTEMALGWLGTGFFLEKYSHQFLNDRKIPHAIISSEKRNENFRFCCSNQCSKDLEQES